MQQGFHAKYWNLAMTAAWAKFRNREMVDKFDGPTPEDWIFIEVVVPSLQA